MTDQGPSGVFYKKGTRTEQRHGNIRRKLISWYRVAARDLPWRRTRDPYRIWVSEVMLQQTRVQAVIPYYHRFLERFPTLGALAEAPEQDLLAAWSGLGYYSRARNLQRAAREMNGAFPDTYEGIRSLSGVGDYTAAAVASIAFGLPHAVLDGNVLRVLSRLENDRSDIGQPVIRRKFQALASELLDRDAPGDFNQAVMELGATVCTPKSPACGDCPLREECRARIAGTVLDLPVKVRRTEPVALERTVYVVRRNGSILLRQRSAGERLMPGFWELPEAGDIAARNTRTAGGFKHSITHHNYSFEVVLASVRGRCTGFSWIREDELARLPLTTIARKALAAAPGDLNREEIANDPI